MIWPIFRKDWILLWPLAVLVTLIQIVLEWALYYKVGKFGAVPVATEVSQLLSPAWYIGIMAFSAAVVQEDTIPGVDQDWLIRPVVRADLLVAKMLFVLATVCLPMLVVNVVNGLAQGFPLGSTLAVAAYKEAYVFLCLLIPAMALGATSRNMTDFVVLVAALVVLYSAVLWMSAMLFGENRCPTCDTSVGWLQRQFQHLGVLAGSVAVLAIQYRVRNTRLSRQILAAGVVLLILVQIPWNIAFALQSWLSAPVGSSPEAIRITAGTTEVDESGGARRGGKRHGARQAASALLEGDVDSAVRNLRKSRAAPSAPVVLIVPLQVAGTMADEFVVVDHAVYSLVDAEGAVLYRAVDTERRAVPLVSDPATPGLLQQKVDIPAAVYRNIGARAVNLLLDFSLTVRTKVAEHRIRALNGEVLSHDAGMCQSGGNQDQAYIRCKLIGPTANCYSAVLFDADGAHNPAVYSCATDYTPFIPSRVNIVNPIGINLPVRDPYGVGQYEVDGADLPDAYIDFKIYRAGAHFRRTVISHLQPRSAN